MEEEANQRSSRFSLWTNEVVERKRLSLSPPGGARKSSSRIRLTRSFVYYFHKSHHGAPSWPATNRASRYYWYQSQEDSISACFIGFCTFFKYIIEIENGRLQEKKTEIWKKLVVGIFGFEQRNEEIVFAFVCAFGDKSKMLCTRPRSRHFEKNPGVSLLELI